MCVYTYESMTDKWIDRLHLKEHLSQISSPSLQVSTPKHWEKTHGGDLVSDWRLALWLAEASLNCNQSCFPYETIKRSLEFWLLSLWMDFLLLLKLCQVWGQCLALFLLESIPHSLGCSSFGFLCVLFLWVSKYDSAAFPAFCCWVFVPFYIWIREEFFQIP